MDTLRREYDIMRRLNHPGIMKPYRWVEFVGAVGFEMPYYPTTLERALETGLDPQFAKQQITGIVQYLFDHGVVHGDLVCKNFFFSTTQRQVVLFDFQTAFYQVQDHFESSIDIVGKIQLF
jgi:tRNA A-37 threonylcarbamoyl transferase component Bud32